MTGIPIIPTYITVHLGRPDRYAPDVTVPFIDYIKNVASSEIYPTWPENALRANIYVQVTFALNRIYTEWYRSRGYGFDITNSTQFDQAFVYGRDIFMNISDLVDELFNDYIRRIGTIEPLFAQFCNGTTVTCDGLSQWGTVPLAEQGMTPFEILQYYYGNDIEIVFNAPVGSVTPSYPGYPLSAGSDTRDVRTLQLRLNRVSRNYPAIPKLTVDGVYGTSTSDVVRAFQRIFNLAPDGIAGEATWYKLEQVYVAIKNLAELQSEGYSLEELNAQFPETLRVGVRGNPVRILQHRLRLIAAFYSTIPVPDADGIFGEGTKEAVSAFQNRFGLSPDGVVGAATWSEIYRIYREIIDAELLLEREELPLVYGGEPLRVGSRGERVQALQNYLNTVRTVWQAIPLLPETGYFGDETRNAVRIFQQAANLTPDGVVGKETWDTLTALYTDIRTGLGRSTGQYPGRTLRQEREEN